MSKESSKGNRMQRELVNQFKSHMETKPQYKLLGEYVVKRTRAKMKNGFFINLGEDIFGDFDALMAYEYSSTSAYNPIVIPYWFQVKSKFDSTYYKGLKLKWSNLMGHAYLCVYGDWANKTKYNKSTKELIGDGDNVIQLKSFKLIRI